MWLEVPYTDDNNTNDDYNADIDTNINAVKLQKLSRPLAKSAIRKPVDAGPHSPEQ